MLPLYSTDSIKIAPLQVMNKRQQFQAFSSQSFSKSSSTSSHPPSSNKSSSKQSISSRNSLKDLLLYPYTKYSHSNFRFAILLFYIVILCVVVYWCFTFLSTFVEFFSLPIFQHARSSSSLQIDDNVIKEQPILNQQMNTNIPEKEQFNTPIVQSVTPNAKQEAVKEALQFAFSGYEKYAFGHDELRPCTNQTNDSWGGMGATLIDSLDTLILMKIVPQEQPILWKKMKQFIFQLQFDQVDKSVSFFETTIRYLGGLLGAYTLLKEDYVEDAYLMLQKATELADRLVYAFQPPMQFPMHQVNLKTGKAENAQWTNEKSILSEVGSFQLEFEYLSQETKNPIYANKARQVMKTLHAMKSPIKGLYPVLIDANSAKFDNSHITIGGLADSFYEYLLKQYLITNQTLYKEMYLESISAIHSQLLKESYPNKHLFVKEMNSDENNNKFEHLSCFYPGLLALGSVTLPNRETNTHLTIAKQIVDTCIFLYETSGSGIGPDAVIFQTEDSKRDDIVTDYVVHDAKYLLRPELIESLFYMYFVTEDSKYQEIGWNIFLQIVKHCKTKSAFSGLKNVNKAIPKDNHNNSQQSFFFAETLKYFYLLFSDLKTKQNSYLNSLHDLRKFVFNTEGHIFRIK